MKNPPRERESQDKHTQIDDKTTRSVEAMKASNKLPLADATHEPTQRA